MLSMNQSTGDNSSLLSPSVRRLMRENNLSDLSAVTGTGKGGRISSADLKHWLESPTADNATPEPESTAVEQASDAADEMPSTMHPHNNMRRRIGLAYG